MESVSRRRFIGALAVTGMAGCTDQSGRASPTQTRAGTSTAGASVTAEMVTDDLDLREANVVGVEFTEQNRRFNFDVTLHHDDDGEDGYANWWQVERLDGTTIGRRKLLHPHSSEPFTRSDTYEIPENVSCVVVRGHDQTHGYGGQAMLVNLDTGATRAVKQGIEPRSFSAEACP